MKKFKFTIRGNEYETEILKMKELTALIEVNGTQYEVELPQHKSRPELSIKRTASFAPKSKSNTEPKSNLYSIKAPLPGVVLQVFVNEGDAVQKNDKLLVYEAMKMENMINTEKAGMIKSVKVKASDTILQDEVLIEIEMESNE